MLTKFISLAVPFKGPGWGDVKQKNNTISMNMPDHCATPYFFEINRVGLKEYDNNPRAREDVYYNSTTFCTIKLRGGYDEYNCPTV